MILVNTDFVPGRDIDSSMGLVMGSTIQSKHIGKDVMAALRTIIGGEIREYTDMMEKSRKIALERMEESATLLGADAVVNIRFSTSSIMAGASEFLAYGTAVKLK